MRKLSEHLDGGSLAVLAVTLVLFVAAVLTQGLTHDLFLEAGVFLVSVKLVIQAYRSSVATRGMSQKLDRILSLLDRGSVAPRDEGR